MHNLFKEISIISLKNANYGSKQRVSNKIRGKVMNKVYLTSLLGKHEK